MLYLNDIPGFAVGVTVEHRPARPIPKRKSYSWDVPGRSGKLIRQLDAWENVTLSYELAVVPPPGVPLGETVDRAVAWLTQQGYMRLYDDADPSVFYLAAYNGGQDLKPVLHRARRATVSFDADPRRFLLSGEESVFLDVSAPAVISNPTPWTAKPLIRIGGSGAGTVSFGSRILRFSDAAGLVIDCESQTAGGTVSADSLLWPELPAGDTTVALTGTGLEAEILPRWYMI